MKSRAGKWSPTLLNLLFTCSLLLALTAAPAAASAPAQAGNPVTLESVRIDVWPEYDQPSVLVIYHVTLASTVSLPASLSLSIPASAGKPYAVAMQDVNGLYDLQYTLTAAGDWIKVNFTTPVPELRIEYYDPDLLKNGSRRDFSFRWPADYTVNNLLVNVQQPVGADAMTFTPDIGAGRADTDGLTYYTKIVGDVPAATTFDLAFSYNKPDDTLTTPQQFQPVEPVQPVESAAAGSITLMGIPFSPWQVLLLVAGILLILVGVVWYGLAAGGFQFLMRVPQDGSRRCHVPRRGGTGPLSADAPEGSGEPVFCHKCGKKSTAGDAFCRACGARLRN